MLVRAFLLVFVSVSLGHICLMYPPQRGGYDISSPGSYSCFQPTAPCGTKFSRTPTFTLQGGTTFNVLLQQNLNHYNPGWPGFIEVAYAVGNNQTSDSQFTALYQISDYWAHFQGTQTNFTIPIKVPNIECDWCTLQVRYNPNKPTEPIFHQCADVKIVQNTAQLPVGLFVGIAKVGGPHSASAGFTESSFVAVDQDTGSLQRLYHIGSHIAQRSLPNEFITSQPDFTVGNGLLTSSHTHKGLVFLGSPYQSQPTDSPVTTLFHLDFEIDGNITHTLLTFPPGITQWVGLLNTFSSSTPAPYLLIGARADSTNVIYTYSVFWLSEDGTITGPIGTSQSNSTFVNYFWADYSACAGSAGQVYVLAGDENSLYQLDVLLITFDIATGQVTSTLVDNSQYTISSIHVWAEKDCTKLYSISPGLVQIPQSTRVWSLIQIDPVTGNVENPVPITEAGMYGMYYGGSVYGLSVTSQGDLPYLFQRENDGSFDLAFVSVSTGAISSVRSLNLGVNSLYSLSSLTLIPHEQYY